MKILITGGSSEIAQALAKARVSKKDEVWVTASSTESLKECLELYAQAGIRAQGVEFSLEEPDRNKAELEPVLSQLDALVLNAASRSVKLRTFTDWNEAGGAAFLRANIDGNLWLLRRTLPGMVERKFGRIVFVSSLSVVQGMSRFPYYCAAKSAVEGLCLNLAVDYGEHNVFVNIVRPGIIATERTKHFWKRSHYLEKVTKVIPALKLGEAAQVAEAMEPLLSPSSFMNGSVVTVSGGLPMMRSAGLLDV